MLNNIELWKIKKIIKSLDLMKGNGTSLISLIIPAKGQLSLINKMLTDEYGTATNIKSRVNKLSVLSAITSTQQKLKLYKTLPTNGLVVFCGNIITDEGKEKKVNIDIVPFKQINKSLYKCDNKFHTDILKELLITNDKYGFIIMDGNGCLYATLSGNNKEILYKFSVDLPKKHGRGGQSALRFSRLRLEARNNYLKKVCEHANNFFIKENKPNIKGIILAGSADFKNQISECNILSYLLKEIIIQSVDISYGGENGLNQAIELSSSFLDNIELMHEKKIISNFFEHISKDTGLYSFGIKDTMYALDIGAVEKLIIYEDLNLIRQELKNPTDNSVSIIYIDPKKNNNSMYFVNEIKLEVINSIEVTEWLCINYSKYGTELILISDKSQEGNQYIKGFGGIGGILRWNVDFEVNQNLNSESYSESSSDNDFF